MANSPTTRRGVETRTTLVVAARRLFERKGFLEANIADIAKIARVAHGTFYTYFDSKEEIFSEVIEHLLADFQKTAEEEPRSTNPNDIAARVERANRGYLRAYERNAKMMAVLEQVATFNSRLAQTRRQNRRFWVERSTRAIDRWKAAGLVDPRLDARYTASALGSMVDRSAYVWIVLGEEYDFDVAVQQLTLLYCNALGVPYVTDSVPSAPGSEDAEGSDGWPASTDGACDPTDQRSGM